jgi:hypothetical protein
MVMFPPFGRSSPPTSRRARGAAQLSVPCVPLRSCRMLCCCVYGRGVAICTPDAMRRNASVGTEPRTARYHCGHGGSERRLTLHHQFFMRCVDSSATMSSRRCTWLATAVCLLACTVTLVRAQSSACGFYNLDFSSLAGADMQGTDGGLNYQYYLRGTRIDAALAGHTSMQDAAAAACGNEAFR